MKNTNVTEIEDKEVQNFYNTFVILGLNSVVVFF